MLPFAAELMVMKGGIRACQAERSYLFTLSIKSGMAKVSSG